MTYTTEEKRTIAEIWYKSRMDTLNQIEKAESEYDGWSESHRAVFNRKITEYERKAENALKVSIMSALSDIRTDGFYIFTNQYNTSTIIVFLAVKPSPMRPK